MNQDLEMPQGKAYQGAKTSRKGLFGGETESEEEDDDEDDEDQIDFDDEEDGDEISLDDEAEEDDDEDDDGLENLLNNGFDDDEEDDDDEGSEEEEGEDVMLNGLSNGVNDYSEEEEGDDDDDEGSEEEDDSDTIAQLQQFQNQEKELIQNLHKNTVQDSDKGKHVLNQLKLWENTLGIRIQFQKIAQSINQLPISNDDDELDWNVSDHQETVDGLVNLINQLNTLRLDLALKSVSEENKFEGLEKRSFESTEKDDLWNDISSLYEIFSQHHEGIVDKWHSKVQLGNTLPLQKKFRSLDQSISQQVDQMMMDSDRLITRSRTNRSNQPIIGYTGDVNEIEQIYDDGDFYQQLLREFIESRMTDHDANGVGLRWMATKRAKQRKVVDTKASKGRKLRYQVHDKLENFMVPIHDGTWHESKIDELFGSLLGNKFTLSDDANKDDDNVEDIAGEETTTADDGLRIFG
jgi:protein AATF/BFR2